VREFGVQESLEELIQAILESPKRLENGRWGEA
jgi:hypothetical protein